MAETAKAKSAFEVLNAVNVNDKKEKKNNLDYLSWAWAWAEVKKKYPNATFEYIKDANGWNYHNDGKTAWVEVAVEIDGLRYEEHLPVMDYKNNSIPLERITSFDVNKAQKRCLAKCIAMHGLGLYIYAGEDLPEETTAQAEEAVKTPKRTPKKATANACSVCGKEITAYGQYTAEVVLQESTKKLGKPTCMACWQKQYAEAKKTQEAKQ